MNETESSDSDNTTLASGPDTNVGPTAGDTQTLQTQVSNNNPVDSGAPTAPPNAGNGGSNTTPAAQDTTPSSGTVIAQGDTPNGPVNPVSDANPASPVDPNSDVPPKQLNVEVNKQIGNPNGQPEQAVTLPNNAPNPFADTLSKLQTVGGLVGAAASALARQQIAQPIQDAFNAFNKFLESPANPGLVDFADRQNGAVVGLAEGLGLLPDLQIADSGSSTGFSSTEESLNNNPSQAFQESRQINNVIGFGLPFVLEGGGAGKPPASSPELVPVGPGVGTPIENPAPLVRAPETGPLETRVENNQGNQGPLESRKPESQGDPTASNLGSTENRSNDLALTRLKTPEGDPIPYGFKSPDEYQSFTQSLKDKLPEGVDALFQGSSVTGKNSQTGEIFDVGRTSDFDIALSNDKLFQQAKDLGYKAKDGTRIGPLNKEQLEQLGLSEVKVQLEQQAGRKVSFMLFDSTNSAYTRPSLLAS